MKEAVAKLDDPRISRRWPSPAWAWTACRLTKQAIGFIPLSAGMTRAPKRSCNGGRNHIGAERTFGSGGNTLWRFSTALRLLWMAEHEPDILARTDKWLLIEDFLNFMLCGRRATDYTMASCTLLFDQRKRDWSEEILAQSGIERRLLCDAYPSGTLWAR